MAVGFGASFVKGIVSGALHIQSKPTSTLRFILTLGKFSKGQVDDILLIFPKKTEDNLHEMSNPIVCKKKK